VVILKTVLLTLLLLLQLGANDRELAIKIYNSIAFECTKKADPKIYLHGDLSTLYETNKINRTYTCSDADFVIVSTLDLLPSSCEGKLVFTNKYRLFMKKPRIIGAFFWQKGRPNIIFAKERLERENITLSTDFQKYIE
jgi:hypothetical protein